MTDPTKKVLGIHGNSSYMEFEFSFFTLPMYLLFTPLIYVPITLIIDLRIFAKLMNSKLEKHINVHLFKSICMFQFMCFLFFIADLFHLRLPTTGIFTRWCASVEPNHFIMSLYILTFYINYATMLFPILISLMRLILILSPRNHEKVRVELDSGYKFQNFR
ncbi:hypothetical protein CRE_22219 [Caenorhabditis remanei]|uniref:Uncharacterized protein n=1 Tax=Caenorhabditis remanei TaxID=31234 RepID=E3NQF3_CAERE|nr:hypothetical protein CRE_22219 [Caenorhabditis remanei]